MTEAAFFEPRRISPIGIAVVIAFHAGLITVAVLSRIEVIPGPKPPPLIITPIPIPPDPPADPTTRKPQTDPIRPQTQIDTPRPIIDPPPLDPGAWVPVGLPPTLPPLGTDLGPLETLKPPPEPIRTDAQLDPRYGDTLKPPYPLNEQRNGIEGTVTLRILIGANGRVKAVEKLAATTDGFFRAAEQQALSRWRFKPATLDGRPVESRKVLTLRFELDA